ncbi:hypothetical protein BX666DRAFT_2026816 [Dichotomocladium elegans]|nr:hypothetical protein BX666DRAFT_2026816 [Dichotomocladium elegans]
MHIYDYTLRCAIRAYHEQTANNASNSIEPPPPPQHRPERHSLHMSNLISSSGKESDKLTRDVVRGLMRRLDDIRKGRDESRMIHQDRTFQNAVAAFYPKLQAQRYIPTGTVNDLVIAFLKTSQAELAREQQQGQTPQHYDKLNQFVARFAEILIQTLQDTDNMTPELSELLNGFLAPVTKKTQRNHPTANNGHSNARSSPLTSATALERFPMVMTVQALFKVSNEDHRRKLQELQRTCTEGAMLVDLKKCLHHISTNQPFPGRKEDFPSQQAYDNWQRREVQQISELIKTLILIKPSLATEESAGLNGARSSEPNCPFTYIPNFPQSYYRKLMELCIDYDTNVVPDNERAKTSVLSQQSDELLRECWKTWRVSAAYRAIIYLEFMTELYQAQKVDIDDIKDAIRGLDKVIKESDPATWTINDREGWIRTYEALNQTILQELEVQLSNYWRVRPGWVDELVSMLDKIYENPAYREDHPDPLRSFSRLKEALQGAAVGRWRHLESQANNASEDSLTNLLTLSDKLIKEIVGLSKQRFTTAIKGVLDVPGQVMAIYMPFFTLIIENWAFTPEARQAPIEVVFELYQKVLSLKRLYDQRGPRQKTAQFRVESWFLQHVRKWLITTHNATPEWVDNAIKQDAIFNWEGEDEPDNRKAFSSESVYSSSIVDLFSMFNQSVDFIQNLQWPNESQLFRFLTSLAKIFAVALERYTSRIESFIAEEFKTLESAGKDKRESSSFLHKARTLTGTSQPIKEGSVPRDITPELCIMVNNIEAARSRLDRLYQLMDVDEVAERMHELASAMPTVEKLGQANFLYSIRVVKAEDLKALDNNGLSDPYVSLFINRREIARTRTVYKSLNPRWDQSFDVTVSERMANVLAVVYDEDVIGTNEECGQAVFRLSPEVYEDYQIHDLQLPLDPQGKLHIRASLVGEKDDIQFWFVKSFRTLKQAEGDAAALIVEQMGQFMRYSLSRKAIDKLLKREKSFFGSFGRSNKHVEPSLQECEEAIFPLLDYLEKNLQTLNDNLSETNMQVVVLKIWNQVLINFEHVMRPQDNDTPPLDEYEERVLVKWLELLKILFNGGEDGDAVPLEKLENMHYVKLVQTVCSRHSDQFA